MRYLGLGWTKAYHPWSKNKHIFSPVELMEHFVKVVLQLQLCPSSLSCSRVEGSSVDDSKGQVPRLWNLPTATATESYIRDTQVRWKPL
jgi:hypothetical protein